MLKKAIGFLIMVTFISTVFFSLNIYAETITPRQEEVLVVLVNFTETVESLSQYPTNCAYDGYIENSDAYYSNLFFGNSGNTAKNYYNEASGQKVELVPAEETNGTPNDGIVRVILNSPHPNKYVSAGIEVGFLDRGARSDIIDSVFNGDLLDPYVDFSKLDKDLPGQPGYGLINTPEELHVLFILAGDPVGPHTRAFNGSLLKYKKLDNMSFSETRVSFVNEYTDLATICHEIAHDSGAVDLYDIDGSQVESLSLMNSTREIPQHLDPWNKIKMGYVEPTIVETSGTYTVNSIDLNNPGKYNVLMVPVQSTNFFDGKEYFLIENKQFKGFDSQLSETFVNGGITVWHINGGNYNSGIDNFRLERADFEAYDVNNKLYLNYMYYKGNMGKDFVGPNAPLDVIGSTKTFAGDDSGITITINSDSADEMSVTIDIIKIPENVKATADGNKTRLTWDSVTGATEYEVSIDNEAFFNVGANTSYTFDNLNKHSYKVRARNEHTAGISSKAIYTVALLYGDVNGDSQITVEDFNALRDYLLGKSPGFTNAQKLVSDLDGNGEVNALDSLLLLKYVNSLVTEFPAGYMEVVTYGDVNGDGIVSLDDLDINKNGVDDDEDIFNEENIISFSQRVAANVNNSHIEIDYLDYRNIQDYLKDRLERFWIMVQ